MTRLRSGKRRRFAAVGVAVALAAATVGFAGAPVGADDAPAIPDVPSLGFSIDPSQGAVGSTVNGQVDVDDIAANCITDPRDFVKQFMGENLDFDSPYFAALGEWAADHPLGDLFSDPPLLIASLLASALPQSLADDPETAEAAMEATFIMGFADLATASPIAPYGNFDPSTGVGSTPVPQLDGGTQVAIATCVGLPDEITVDDIDAALRAGAAFVEANYDLPDSPLDFDLPGEAMNIAPSILVALVEQMALGIATFCVDDGQGSCDEPENTDGPNGNGEEPNGNEPNGNGEGPDGDGNGNGPGGSGDGAQPATPVSGSPTYAG